ncbi:uncharacterized protein LOC102151865 isoform X2 [Canis lupus familiaris]|uniref:uncharacterized protein LOC102151865 isoform X2 n=1 Tax=Canis lupus familiaris TaxID=9615 RepID=UPI0018F79D0E|nr:uncharacterized protein LOC102151865 isoform X2 [Canis lupus familiaris]
MKIEEMYFRWWRSLRCEQSWKEPEAAEDTRDEVEVGIEAANQLVSWGRQRMDCVGVMPLADVLTITPQVLGTRPASPPPGC